MRAIFPTILAVTFGLRSLAAVPPPSPAAAAAGEERLIGTTWLWGRYEVEETVTFLADGRGLFNGHESAKFSWHLEPGTNRTQGTTAQGSNCSFDFDPGWQTGTLRAGNQAPRPPHLLPPPSPAARAARTLAPAALLQRLIGTTWHYGTEGGHENTVTFLAGGQYSFSEKDGLFPWQPVPGQNSISGISPFGNPFYMDFDPAGERGVFSATNGHARRVWRLIPAPASSALAAGPARLPGVTSGARLAPLPAPPSAGENSFFGIPLGEWKVGK